jgi:hypothetical protein
LQPKQPTCPDAVRQPITSEAQLECIGSRQETDRAVLIACARHHLASVPDIPNAPHA